MHSDGEQQTKVPAVATSGYVYTNVKVYYQEDVDELLEAFHSHLIEEVEKLKKPDFTDVTPDSPDIYMDYGYNQAVDDFISLLKRKV